MKKDNILLEQRFNQVRSRLNEGTKKLENNPAKSLTFIKNNIIKMIASMQGEIKHIDSITDDLDEELYNLYDSTIVLYNYVEEMLETTIAKMENRTPVPVTISDDEYI